MVTSSVFSILSPSYHLIVYNPWDIFNTVYRNSVDMLNSVKEVGDNTFKIGKNNLGGILESRKNFRPLAAVGGSMIYNAASTDHAAWKILPLCVLLLLLFFYSDHVGPLAFNYSQNNRLWNS